MSEDFEVKERAGLYVAISNTPKIYAYGRTEEEARRNLGILLEEEEECVDI